jgi:peptidoglycan LD-endopeptidase LytH
LKDSNSKPTGKHRLVVVLSAFTILLLTPGRSFACGDTSDWQQFERRVKEDSISPEEGRVEITCWAGQLDKRFPGPGFSSKIHFPVEGYGPKQIGGRQGEAYQAKSYAFVGERRRRGHPAQDIFVYDGNQDSLDDRTGKPVTILALADGVVLSTFCEWTPELSQLGNGRGGNYVWIYHPALKLFTYYAHLRDVYVNVGERVGGGSQIATLGRTGTRAYAERSPTHLHLMLLRVADMTPINPYMLLHNLPQPPTGWRKTPVKAAGMPQ